MAHGKQYRQNAHPFYKLVYGLLALSIGKVPYANEKKNNLPIMPKIVP